MKKWLLKSLIFLLIADRTFSKPQIMGGIQERSSANSRLPEIRQQDIQKRQVQTNKQSVQLQTQQEEKCKAMDGIETIITGQGRTEGNRYIYIRYLYFFTTFKDTKKSRTEIRLNLQMVPIRGIEPRVHPYHGRVLPLYYTGICLLPVHYSN